MRYIFVIKVYLHPELPLGFDFENILLYLFMDRVPALNPEVVPWFS